MRIAGVVLAAGAGRRYGRPKALASHQGIPLLRRAASALASIPSVVVVGAAAAQVRAFAPDLTYVDNPDWESGLGSSLRAGLAAVAGADAAIVTLVDMPGVTHAAVTRIAAFASPDALVMGGYGDRRGHPVLLGRDHWTGVAAAAVGDRGARDYLRAHDVRVVDVSDIADDTDLDVPPAHPGHTDPSAT
ncbi:NTP transferase domain-containing protein [Actinoplanes sp. NPDC049265]|uniref:nucleotidyltransferase family protein n=1 Tax=Actinoplanes sp. NPDC049265 TaxID=3363902 RepID=UPI00371CB46C